MVDIRYSVGCINAHCLGRTAVQTGCLFWLQNEENIIRQVLLCHKYRMWHMEYVITPDWVLAIR